MTLDRPTLMQISATERSVVRSSADARSRRRLTRYACGDSPKAWRNAAENWERDRRAARARSSTRIGSA